jgi:membrane protein
VPRLGAGLAYYTVFSIAPLLVIAVAIVSLILDEQVVREQVQAQTVTYFGEGGAKVVHGLIRSAQLSRAGFWATAISLGGLLFAATGSVIALKDALNTIWGVMEDPKRSWWSVIVNRLLSLLLVLAAGVLLLSSVALTTVLTAMGHFVADYTSISLPLARAIDLLVSFIIVTIMFAIIFKWLPNALIAWRTVAVGAAVTAALFLVGKELVGLYLARASVRSTYGAAGSFAILLLWAYYSSQIFLLGAEFTQVYARETGERIEPDSHAIRLSDGIRQVQAAMKKEQPCP